MRAEPREKAGQFGSRVLRSIFTRAFWTRKRLIIVVGLLFAVGLYYFHPWSAFSGGSSGLDAADRQSAIDWIEHSCNGVHAVGDPTDVEYYKAYDNPLWGRIYGTWVTFKTDGDDEASVFLPTGSYAELDGTVHVDCP